MSVTAEKIDIDAVGAGPELNALVAECVMGWERMVSDEHMPRSLRWRVPWDVEGEEVQALTVFPFSTDANRAREVEAEIARRGLSQQYVSHLVNLTHLPMMEGSRLDMFKLITATPVQRCRAAYRAVMEAGSWTDAADWKLEEDKR